MKYRIFFLFLSLLLALSLTTKAAAQTNDFNTQLKNVAAKIRAKRVAWKISEADLAPELKELDTIYAQHKGGNAEDLASVLLLKATVYWSVAPKKASPWCARSNRTTPIPAWAVMPTAEST